MNESSEQQKVYALNLFDVADADKYLEYFRGAATEVPAHGGRPVAVGRFRSNVTGDITPRQVLVLVEWESEAAFNSFRDDPALAELHPLRENASSSYVWQLFDGADLTDPALEFEDVVPLLRP